MQVANSYVLKSSAVTNSVIESISQQLIQRSKKGAQVAMGKKELSFFRTLLLHDVAVHGELEVNTIAALIALLNGFTESDSGSNDRKIYRCILYLLMENLCIRNVSLKPEKAAQYKEVKSKLLEILHHEIAHRKGTHRVLVMRLLGVAAGPAASQSLPLSSMDKQRAYELMVQVLSTTQLPSYAKGGNSSQLAAAAGGDSNRDADNKVLQLIGCCSALRRINRPVPSGQLQLLLNFMKLNNRTIVRHVAALLLVYTSQPSDDYDPLIATHLLSDSIKHCAAPSSNLKDDLALSYLLRATRVVLDQANASKDGKRVEAAYGMIHEVMLLIPQTSLKSLAEIIRLYFRTAEDWDNIVARMEDQHSNLVQLVIFMLSANIKSVAPDDVRFPIFCRACESIGRFLCLRPAFSSQRNHRVFSVRAAERDGEQLSNLWKTLLFYHKYMTDPKEAYACLPPVIKSANIDLGINSDAEQERKSFWTFEHEDPAKICKSIPSPYLFTCLLKAMVWVAADPRYAPKSYEARWAEFQKLLVFSLEVLACATISSESYVGDITLLVPELLQNLLSRAHASMLLFTPKTTSGSTDRGSLNGNGSASDTNSTTNLFLSVMTNPMPISDSLDKETLRIYFRYIPAYLDTLYAVSALALRITTSAAVIRLLPRVWSLGLALGTHTENVEHRLHACEALLWHLLDIVTMVEGAHKFRAPMKKEILLSLQESAIWQVSHTVPLLLSVLDAHAKKFGRSSQSENGILALASFLKPFQLTSHLVGAEAVMQRLVAIGAGIVQHLIESKKQAHRQSQLQQSKLPNDSLLGLDFASAPSTDRVVSTMEALLEILDALHGISSLSESPSLAASHRLGARTEFSQLHAIKGIVDQLASWVKDSLSSALPVVDEIITPGAAAQRVNGHNVPSHQLDELLAAVRVLSSDTSTSRAASSGASSSSSSSVPPFTSLSVLSTLAMGVFHSNHCSWMEAPSPSEAAKTFTDLNFLPFEAPRVAASEKPASSNAKKGSQLVNAFASKPAAATRGRERADSESSGPAAAGGKERSGLPTEKEVDKNGPISFDDLPADDLSTTLSTQARSTSSSNGQFSSSLPMDWDFVVPSSTQSHISPATASASFFVGSTTSASAANFSFDAMSDFLDFTSAPPKSSSLAAASGPSGTASTAPGSSGTAPRSLAAGFDSAYDFPSEFGNSSGGFPGFGSNEPPAAAASHFDSFDSFTSFSHGKQAVPSLSMDDHSQHSTSTGTSELFAQDTGPAAAFLPPPPLPASTATTAKRLASSGSIASMGPASTTSAAASSSWMDDGFATGKPTQEKFPRASPPTATLDIHAAESDIFGSSPQRSSLTPPLAKSTLGKQASPSPATVGIAATASDFDLLAASTSSASSASAFQAKPSAGLDRAVPVDPWASESMPSAAPPTNFAAPAAAKFEASNALDDIFGSSQLSSAAAAPPSSSSSYVFSSSKTAPSKNANSLFTINISDKPVEKVAAPVKSLPLAPPKPAGVVTSKGRRQSMAATSAVFNDDLSGLLVTPVSASAATVGAKTAAPVDPFGTFPSVSPTLPAAAPVAGSTARKTPPLDPFAFPAPATSAASQTAATSGANASTAGFDFASPVNAFGAPSSSASAGWNIAPSIRSTPPPADPFGFPPAASTASSGFGSVPPTMGGVAWPAPAPQTQSMAYPPKMGLDGLGAVPAFPPSTAPFAPVGGTMPPAVVAPGGGFPHSSAFGAGVPMQPWPEQAMPNKAAPRNPFDDLS